MKTKWLFLFIFFMAIMQDAFCQRNEKQEIKLKVLKPRVVVLTDVSTWETDDSESLVRIMVHADLFEIE